MTAWHDESSADQWTQKRSAEQLLAQLIRNHTPLVFLQFSYLWSFFRSTTASGLGKNLRKTSKEGAISKE